MIKVLLKGGLGNQMFQYALGRALSISNKTNLVLDTSYLDLEIKKITKRNYDLDVFGIEINNINSNTPFIFKTFKNKILTNLFLMIRKVFRVKGQEMSYNFNPEILNVGSDAYLSGYFQSYKYFEKYKDQIIKDFTFKNIPNNIEVLAGEISNTNSVCIHVRRGDYVGNKNHEVVNLDYYKKGIDIISQKTKIEKIYVFSDDIAWCRSNLKFDFDTIFVGEEYVGYKDSGHMYLMSKCRNFIIANSSFSWWAAWLAPRSDKMVICPKKWFGDSSINTNDLIPETWIRI